MQDSVCPNNAKVDDIIIDFVLNQWNGIIPCVFLELVHY